MPTVRYQIRNEYGLSDPDLYRAADKDDPEAVLEGVAMAGLVGVLRQLGDLAEFAAGIFHDLHEEVTATAARGHGLMLRVQQLEAEFPSIEKAFLVQTNHSNFAYDDGIDWHANLRINQNLVTQGDMPRFVLDSYEECRGPPRLFMLDKFDVAGAGACLKRYSDPSFFKVEFASSGMMEEEVQLEKKPRKIKKRASRWKNGETIESFFAPLINSNLQQERDDKVLTKFPTRQVKLKSRNLHESVIANRRSYMEHLLEVHSSEEKVWPENSISHSPVDIKSIESSGLTLEVCETIIDAISESTIIRETYPTESPTRKEVTYIPRNEMESRHLKSVRQLKSVPRERITSESEIEAHISDDGYLSCKAENSSSPLHEEKLKISFTDGEFTTNGSLDGDKSIGCRSDEDEKSPKKKSLDYGEFNSAGDYEDYKSDNISSDLDNYVDALNTIGSEIEADSGRRVESDPAFSNTIPPAVDSGIYEQQEVPVQPLEPFSVKKSTSSRDVNSVVVHSTTNSVNSGDVADTQQPLQQVNRDNFLKESPDKTPDETQSNSEVRECASSIHVLPSETSNAKESYVSSLIMSEAGEASAESFVIDLTSSPLPDERVSDHVEGIHVVSQQMDGKVEGLPNFSNNHEDFSCEKIHLSEGNALSLNGRYVLEGINPADCVVEQISEFDTLDPCSKGQSASEDIPAQHIEKSTVTLTANLEKQQESVNVVGVSLDGNVSPNIAEASPENDACIVHPPVLAEEMSSNDVKHSHEVAWDLDGILSHTVDSEFTDPIVNLRILSDDLPPHSEDAGLVFFKDLEDTQGQTIPEEVPVEHVEDSPPLSTMQLGALHDPVELDNKTSCANMTPSDSAFYLQNSQFTKQPEAFALGVENIVAGGEDNAEVVEEREAHLPDTVPLDLEYFCDADDSQKLHGVNTEELLTWSSEKESFLDDMELKLHSSIEESGANNIPMPNMKSLELGHLSDVEEMRDQESHNADSTDEVSLDSASVIGSAGVLPQDEEPERIGNSNAEESKEIPLAASIGHLPLYSVNEIFLDDKLVSNSEDDPGVICTEDDPKESSSVVSAEQFHLDSADKMFPDDIQERYTELGCRVKDVADTMELRSESDLHEGSLQLEKPIDDDPSDEFVIVEADDNSQSTCSLSSQSGKTSGFDVQLQENYLPHDAVLSRHDLEVKDSSDQDNLTAPAQNESQPKHSAEISSFMLLVQHLSGDFDPSNTKLLDTNAKEDVQDISSENEDSGSKQDTSPSTHFLLHPKTAPGDGGEPDVVSSHQEGEELRGLDTQCQRPCTNDTNLTLSIHRDTEDEPSKPEHCVVDSKDETDEMDTSLCDIGIPEKGVAEAFVASRCSFEILELQPIASSSQAISETRLQEALEPWLDEPTSSFQLPDVDETPPLPPLPPLEWRLGNLRLAFLTSNGDTVQHPLPSNPFVEPTSGEEKYSQGPVKTTLEMFQPEKPFASLPVVENERYQHGSLMPNKEIAQPSSVSLLPPTADEEREHKSLSLEAEMTSPLSSFEVSHTKDGKFSDGQGEWQHGQHKRPQLARLIPSLELERSQHEALSVGREPMLPMNPFFAGPSTEEWNHQHGYGVYGGGSAQHLNLRPPLDARGLNMPPYGFLYSMGENPPTMYNYMIPTMDGDKPNWKYRSIRDRPRDPLIEAVAAHDKSKLRKVTELDRSSVKPKTDEKDSLLEQIRNKSFNLKPANAMKTSIKGVPPTNLKVAAILEKANAIRQACAGSDEDDDDSWG